MYVKGEDDHLVFKLCKNRKDAEKELERQLQLYYICYEEGTSEHGVLTNSKFLEKFPSEEHQRSVNWRRLGNKLREKIDDYKEWRRKE